MFGRVGRTVRNVTIAGVGTVGVWEGGQLLLNEEGREWMSTAGPDDILQGLTQFFSENTGEGQARAEAAVMTEGLGAYVEQFGLILNRLFGGGDAFLGMMNFGRSLLDDSPPLIYDAHTDSFIETANIDAPPTAVNTTYGPDVDPNGPDVDPTVIQLRTDFTEFAEVRSNGNRNPSQGHFGDAYEAAAERLGITLDETLTLERALDIARAADPLMSEEIEVLLADPYARALFERDFMIAKSDTRGPTNFEGNISGFFRAAHDGLVANSGANITTAPVAFFEGLTNG